MPPQNLRLVPSFFHETGRSQVRFFLSNICLHFMDAFETFFIKFAKKTL